MRRESLRHRIRTRSRSGSAAIEFAFVAPIFLMLLFGMFEFGIMFFGRSVLSNAVQDSARLIRTGQAQTGAMQGDFPQQICNRISKLFDDCAKLTVDVQVYPAGFSPPTSPFDANGNLQSNYDPGAPCDVVVVRAFYKYTIFTPLIAPLLGGKNFTYLSAAAAFRNEPFTAAVNGC
ncbi:MAG TPA: TadE/TadG family type IV pilus assembly protein [Rhizomicrobium sp.]|nr:TadE/TadG family type IV pilus assembly protein [Rhizomicrobium sp.]